MPDQSPADLIRQYLSNADRLEEIAIEQKNLKAAQKDLPRQIRKALPSKRLYEPVKFFDGDTGCIVVLNENYLGDIEISVEEPPSLDTLKWPERELSPEPEPMPVDAFELPAVAEAVATCADDVAF